MPGNDEEITVLRAVYEELLSTGKVKNQNDFANQIEFNPVATSMMLRGSKAINTRVLENLHQKFNVDTNIFFAYPKDSIYHTKFDEIELSSCRQENEKLKMQIDALIKAIDRLNETVK